MTHHRSITLAALPLVLLVFAAACSKPTGPEPQIPSLPPVSVTDTVLVLADFNAENGGTGTYNYTDFHHWSVIAGCVDLHGNGFVDVLPNNGIYVDLDGTCDEGGTLESKTEYVLSPGTYKLEFWLAGNNRIDTPDTVIVSLGALHHEQIVLARSEPFQLFTRNITVVAETNARIRFQNLGGDNRGALLDLVRLRRVN